MGKAPHKLIIKAWAEVINCGEAGQGYLNCIETLVMHSKCFRGFYNLVINLIKAQEIKAPPEAIGFITPPKSYIPTWQTLDFRSSLTKIWSRTGCLYANTSILSSLM